MTGQKTKDYPGISVFCRHLEREYQKMSSQSYFARVKKKLGHAFDVENCWSWYLKVLDTWGQLERDTEGDPTIKQLVHQIGAGYLKFHSRNLVAQAIITTLVLLSASMGPAELKGWPRKKRHGPMLRLWASYRGAARDWRGSAHQSSRLVFLTLRRRQQESSRCPRSNDLSTESLFPASMNFASLSRTGPWTIKLVDTLAEHLSLDHSSRTLSVFRYLSYCAAITLKEPKSSDLALR